MERSIAVSDRIEVVEHIRIHKLRTEQEKFFKNRVLLTWIIANI